MRVGREAGIADQEAGAGIVAGGARRKRVGETFGEARGSENGPSREEGREARGGSERRAGARNIGAVQSSEQARLRVTDNYLRLAEWNGSAADTRHDLRQPPNSGANVGNLDAEVATRRHGEADAVEGDAPASHLTSTAGHEAAPVVHEEDCIHGLVVVIYPVGDTDRQVDGEVSRQYRPRVGAGTLQENVAHAFGKAFRTHLKRHAGDHA